MNNTHDYLAEGFVFDNYNDARQAQQEYKKIAYLERHMDYSTPENILAVYEKAIEDRVFKTPVGIVYLKRLQSYLLEEASIEPEKISPIPVFYTCEPVLRETDSPARQRIREPQKQKKRFPVLPFSIFLNLALITAVIAMFAVTLGSEHPNVFNYRRALTDQYASWEQELTQRERIVREKEKELGLE